MVFLTLLAIPLIFSALAFFVTKGITWKEFLLQVGVQLLVAAAAVGIIHYQNFSDTELLNGVVTGKKQVYVSCEHSYRCNCRNECSGSGKDRSCSEVCDTCYEHSNDWDWRVYSSIGYTTNIHRIDRRGSNEPPRYTAVQLNEPFSAEHRYDNYVKAAPDTLLRHQGLVEKYKRFLPDYPVQTYDYYRADRLVLINGARVPDAREWNNRLSEINGHLGSRKQANMIVVLVKNLPQDYVYALEEKWILGKKNDVILVTGVDNDNVPKWAYVMAWTHQELIKVTLRDQIMDLPTLEREKVLEIFETEVRSKFVRQPMADFEYLAATAVPTPMQYSLSILIGLIIAAFLAFYLNENNVL